jgi:pyrimidine operon attenuation protein/uracil phosphoribosyltransferase
MALENHATGVMSMLIMTAEEINATLESLADRLLQNHPLGERLALIGIQRRGVYLAARLAENLEQKLQGHSPGHKIPSGVLDISLYRDDWTTNDFRPIVRNTRLDFNVQGLDLVLVDDVLFTGRTVRSALEALADFGRPNKVELLALIDRGHRELPIQPDYTGKQVKTERAEQVDVLLRELDGQDEVRLRKKPGAI